MPYKDPEEQRASQRLSQAKRYARDPSVRERRTQWNRDNPEKARAAAKRAYAKLKAKRAADPLFDLAYRERRRALNARRREKVNARKRERWATDVEYRKKRIAMVDAWRQKNGRSEGRALPSWLVGEVPSVPIVSATVHQPK